MNACPVKLRFIFLHLLLLKIILPVKAEQPVVTERIHTGDNLSDGSVHALGNGKMLVYEKGPDIIEIYPGPFSTPSLFRFELISDDQVTVLSSRETGTAIWTHSIYNGSRSAGKFTDLVDTQLTCLMRNYSLNAALTFRLKLNDYARIIKSNTGKQKGSLLIMVQSGTLFYQKYAYPRPLYHLISWKGNVTIEQSSGNKKEYIIKVGRGNSEIHFVGGPEYPQVITDTEVADKLTFTAAYDRTKAWWQEFASSGTDFTKLLPADLPYRQKLLRTIDDVSVMIRSQQSREGSVIAGYPYPLGYVRDQYGVSRGLLALGYTAEAKKILEFYWNIWKHYGELHNAQGIGTDGVFHIHENDEVEIPGYLIVQSFDYLEKSGDNYFMENIFPMLEWCWDAQRRNLAGGMLPFNGDETYVAGGFLPRSALNDGSAEATMLFIDGGEKLLDWILRNRKWPETRIKAEKQVLESTRDAFRTNFWINGQLITNNPERLKFIEPPRFRHGVCERSGPDCIISGKKGFGGIDWTERDANGRYQCPVCLALGPLPKADHTRYNLISVSLIPLYMKSSLFSPSELKPMVEKVYSRFEKTGILSCIFDTSDSANNRRSVGYDYGFLLNAMLETGMKMNQSEVLYKKTLAVTDSSGVWSEYYDNHLPRGTRYRPWESAINIEALLRFAETYGKQ